MVLSTASFSLRHLSFQYSLCRVVLMVTAGFALGARLGFTFSTRSVESF